MEEISSSSLLAWFQSYPMVISSRGLMFLVAKRPKWIPRSVGLEIQIRLTLALGAQLRRTYRASFPLSRASM